MVLLSARKTEQVYHTGCSEVLDKNTFIPNNIKTNVIIIYTAAHAQIRRYGMTITAALIIALALT